MAIPYGDNPNRHAYERGMVLDIFQHPLGNFSNKGASARVSQLTVVKIHDLRNGLTVPVPRECRVFAPVDSAPVAALIVRQMGEKTLLHVTPNNRSRTPHSAMMGGCYVATSDSRWTALLEEWIGHGFYGALPLHDRWED